MATTVSDHLVHRLTEWGVRRIYGYPGDGINGVFGALDRAKEEIDFIRATHEELAAFMACGHAKYTGELGVCIATSGPGAIHLLNGLYDAKLDHQPVLAIVGQQSRKSLGGAYQQEVDLASLFKDVAGEYVQMLVDPAQVRHLVDRAIRIALSERTVTCLILPNDIQEMDAVETPPRAHGTIHSSVGYSRPRVLPAQADLQRAADVLNAGSRVAILVGAGALGAEQLVLEVADKLGAGIAKALLGKAAVADAYPFVTGSIGILGTKPSWDLMNDCDTLLMIGSSFPYSEFLPKEGDARGVQIDLDSRMLGIRYPMEVNLTGDTTDTLTALLPLLTRKTDRSWREEIETNVREWDALIEERAMEPAKPVNPQRVFQELSRRLPEQCMLSADSGTVAIWYAIYLKLRSGMKATLSGNLATMCPGVPYAIAAKFAFPDRVAIALVGDGAMQMLGNDALLTIARHWKSWSDPRLIVMVLNNRDLNMVTWEMRITEGNPKFAASQDVDDFPYARYADMIGLEGIRVDTPEGIGPAWDRALSAERPVVLEMITDPDVPPLPPHISLEQAKKYSMAVMKGDPNSRGIIAESVKQLMAGWRKRKE